jgi:tRNA/rRNA methyltransferase
MPERIKLEHICVVLLRPRYSENIGATARAILNMGISRLKVVDPVNYDASRAMKMATHTAVHVVEQIGFESDLGAALAPFSYVVGTTARLGGQRQVVLTPKVCAGQLVSISHYNQVAILFGPEDRGLTNEDIRYCDALVNIPTDRFSSINLAQAVMIMCYELFSAARTVGKHYEPRLANKYELAGMYDQLKDILVRISYIQPDNPDYWMNKFRHFFSRIGLRAKEVSIIRGICRQIDWYGRKSYQDGVTDTQNVFKKTDRM